MAGIRIDFQRVHVEEALAVQRHAGQRGVVQRRLHNVRVLGLWRELEHATGEERQRNRGAGLGVGGVVGQVVVVGECLAVHRAADAAGNVQFLIDDIAPEPLGRIGEVLVVGQSGHVRQTGVEVAGAHGMAYGFVLFGDRLVRLVIGVPVGVRVGFVVGVGVALCVLVCLNIEDVRLPAALGHEIFGQIKVPLFAGDLVQPHQSHLGNLVTGVTTQLARLATEALVYVIGETAGGLEQLVFAGALVVGHRTFNEVAEAVQFVMVTQIGERAIHVVQNVAGVQIAVVELGGTHDVDGLVGGLFQCGVRVMGEGIADCLHPLGEVGVLEHEAVELVWVGIGRVFGERLKSAERVLRRHERLALGILALVLRGSGLEVVHAVAGGRAGDVIVQGVPLIGNHSRAHEFLLGAPERIGDGDVFQGQRLAMQRSHDVLLWTMRHSSTICIGTYDTCARASSKVDKSLAGWNRRRISARTISPGESPDEYTATYTTDGPQTSPT